MVSPLAFMVPPPPPWLSMAQLTIQLKQALEQPAPPAPESAPPAKDEVPHTVDMLV